MSAPKPISAYDRSPEQAREHTAQLESLLPLIRHLVARRIGTTGPLVNLREDIEQFCAMEVWKALPRWEPERGLKLGTWITPRILGAVGDFLRGNYMMQGGARKGRTENIVSFAALSHSDNQKWSTNEEYEFDPEDFRIAAQAVKSVEDRDQVEKILRENCNEQSREVLRLYFLENLTMGEVAQKVGVSQSRISQVMGELLARLADVVGANGVAREIKSRGTKKKPSKRNYKGKQLRKKPLRKYWDKG